MRNNSDNSANTIIHLIESGAASDVIVRYFVEQASQNNLHPFELLLKMESTGYHDVNHAIIKSLLESESENWSAWSMALGFLSRTKQYQTLIPIGLEATQKWPHEGSPYMYLAYAYKYTDQGKLVLNILKAGQKNTGIPIFYQAASLQELPSNILEALSSDASIEKDDYQFPTHQPAPDDSLPYLETSEGQEIGMTGAAISGSLANTQWGSEYAFEYGYESQDLNKQTTWKPSPPGLFCEIFDDTLRNFSNWLCYGTEHFFSSSCLSITSTWPFAIDRNHLDGVGQLTLLYGWSPSSLPTADTILAHSHLHAIDLRNATISFQVKHTETASYGSELVLGLSSFLTEGRLTNDGRKTWTASQWMMTGHPISWIDTPDGQWHDISFNISANPADWSYGASNISEHGDDNGHLSSDRYTYMPLSKVTADHNRNIVVCGMFADELAIPEGCIALRRGRIRYRDWSMLRNGYGAELVEHTGSSKDDALKLTNGLYRSEVDGLSVPSQENLTGCKFVWKLPEGASVDGVALIQHPRHPVKLAQIYLRDGGVDGKIVFAGMSNLPKLDYKSTKRTLISFPKQLAATHLEVRLLQGYENSRLGLMGIEAFGSFKPMITEVNPVTVCEDIEALKPGSHLFYRLIYRSGEHIHRGDIRSIFIPDKTVPILSSIKMHSENHRTWLVHGNPMGYDTRIIVHVDDREILSLPFGRGTYRRHILIRMSDDQYVAGKALSITATNENGSSAPLIVMLP